MFASNNLGLSCCMGDLTSHQRSRQSIIEWVNTCREGERAVGPKTLSINFLVKQRSGFLLMNHILAPL